MTAGALGEERPTLFLRNATGLVRGWSVRDSMIYATLSTNVVTLGLVEWTVQSSFPHGNLLYSILISGVWVSFLVVAYTGLVVTIPRAGGDYVWQTRILGSGIGFVMAATGWWFILWLWAPIYGNILAVQLFEPLWATLKWTWPGGGSMSWRTERRFACPWNACARPSAGWMTGTNGSNGQPGNGCWWRGARWRAPPPGWRRSAP